MDKTRLKCLGALYGKGEAPSTEEIRLQVEQDKAERSLGESERNHQIRLHRWLTREGVPHFAPYNEGNLINCAENDKEKAGRAAKMMGMSPGVPDLVIPIARKPHHGLYIELKARPNGVVSGAQEWWLKTLVLQSYAAHVSWSFEESIKIVEDYLALPLWPSSSQREQFDNKMLAHGE